MLTRLARSKQYDGWTGCAANAAFSVDAFSAAGRTDAFPASVMEPMEGWIPDRERPYCPDPESVWSYEAGHGGAALCSVYPDVTVGDLMAVAAKVETGNVFSVAASSSSQNESSVWQLDAGRAADFHVTVDGVAGIRGNGFLSISSRFEARPAVAGEMGIGRRICIWNQRFNL